MPFRFVHAADIHLDSPLRSLALRDRDLAELVGNATRQALVRIIDLCLEESVDALILSGDLYDGDQRSMKTARFLAEQVARLHAAAIRVFVIRGNHDALSKTLQELTFPDSVKVFGGRAEAVTIEAVGGGPDVVVHGVSFAEPQAPASLLPKFKPPVAGAINVGLLHTSLGGVAGHDVYAPVSEAELHDAGFGYWALGHIHKRSTAVGASTVVMPGIPQGRDINEAGAKSATLVTVADDGSIGIEERLTSVAQFERVDADLTGAEDMRDAMVRIARQLEEARSAARSDHLVVRLTLKGATPLAWQLRREPDRLHADAAFHAAQVGRTWLEKIELRTSPLATPAAARTAADPLIELQRLIEGDVLPSEGFHSEAETIAEELMRQLPQECRDLLGRDEDAHAAHLADLAREGVDDVLARLRAVTSAA